MEAKRKGIVARQGMKEAGSKTATRWTRTGKEALHIRTSRRITMKSAIHQGYGGGQPWRIGKSPALNIAFNNEFFSKLGLPSFAIR